MIGKHNVFTILMPNRESYDAIEWAGMMYVPERTCNFENAGDLPDMVHPTVWFCSECGSPIYNDMEPEYCIYCGARVERDA